MLLQNNLRYISLAEKFQKYRPFRVRNQSNMDYPLQTQKAGLLQIPLPPIVSQIPQVGGRGYIGVSQNAYVWISFHKSFQHVFGLENRTKSLILRPRENPIRFGPKSTIFGQTFSIFGLKKMRF